MKPVKNEISNLINRRNTLIKSIANNSEENDVIEAINHKIADLEAEENRNKIIKNFGQFSEDPENINISEMWKML